MKKITLDYSQSLDFVDERDIYCMQEQVSRCHELLHSKTGEGNNYLGWIDLPNDYDKQEFNRIKETAEKIRKQSKVFIVIGIGGSYLGARAAIEFLNMNSCTCAYSGNPDTPEIYFAGCNISSTYLKKIYNNIQGKDVSINVISKSGTTTEPAIAFRLLKEYMEERYGKEEAKKRIYITTDKSKGALKELADREGYETFSIPDDIGGRYSVLTSVGLLPMAVAGIDIESVINGSQAACSDLAVDDLRENAAYQYAGIRNILYSKGKNIEAVVSYEPNLLYFGEWYKQLFGESEGKDGKGIFPTTLSFTTDLHSMGQYIQEGRKNIFEIVLNIQEVCDDIIIKKTEDDLDGLNYLENKTLDYVNKKAMEGVIMAHKQGGVANLMINIPELSPYYLGYLIYFFEKACGMSGYLLGVNPFNQPGVEAYKKNMFHILGKPGY